MQFEFLANYRKAIPIIGHWYNKEWGLRLRNETEQESVESLKQYLNIDKIPFILIALESAEIIGAAQLKFREMEELFPEKEHWLGGVFVAPEYRGHGVGARLVQKIVSIAPSYGVSILHLQTEKLDGGLYLRLGWKPLEKVANHGMDVLVMERYIGT